MLELCQEVDIESSGLQEEGRREVQTTDRQRTDIVRYEVV